MDNLMTTNQVASSLGCVRSYIDILMLKGLLNPVSTIYPRYYFDRSEVMKLKSRTNTKNTTNV